MATQILPKYYCCNDLERTMRHKDKIISFSTNGYFLKVVEITSVASKQRLIDKYNDYKKEHPHMWLPETPTIEQTPSMYNPIKYCPYCGNNLT